MTQTFEDAGNYGKEFVDTGLKSLAALSKGAQAIAVESAEYAKKSFETGNAALRHAFRTNFIAFQEFMYELCNGRSLYRQEAPDGRDSGRE